MLTTLIPAVKTTPISMHSVGTLQSRVIALNQENYHANMVASSSNSVMETNSSQCDYCKLLVNIKCYEHPCSEWFMKKCWYSDCYALILYYEIDGEEMN